VKTASPRFLIIKTGALGDVLRTTSIVTGLRRRFGADLELTWLTATGARPLLEGLVGRGIDKLLAVDPKDAETIAALAGELGDAPFERILSFDDEPPFCALATALAGERLEECVIGAYLAPEGERTYTLAAAPWFDMGLLSRFGKEEADRLKIVNERSHPAIFAEMLGIEPGEPQLHLPADVTDAAARAFAGCGHPLIGLNTGAGGRWRSKALPEERVVALARELDTRLAEPGVRPTFVLLGGPEERERNERLSAGLRASGLTLVDPGCDNSLLSFAGLVGGLDLLVTSDSLALHMATARKVPTVAFFAPTSAAEIELYGRGQKVASTAPDACSYARDADTSTLTVDRLARAVMGTIVRK
jgi:heptosyltransferase-2